MADFLPLAALGRRILICGPSASGKSTLAAALGLKLGLPVVHLDALRFIPDRDWVERPDPDFARDIEASAALDSWVIEGNYFRFIAPRLARATGIVQLEDHRAANYIRYLRRTLADPVRLGGIAGGSERVNWKMTRWILIDEPKRRQPKIALLRQSGLPLVELASMRQLNMLHAAWDLPRR